jgi:hypothetical protein
MTRFKSVLGVVVVVAALAIAMMTIAWTPAASAGDGSRGDQRAIGLAGRDDGEPGDCDPDEENCQTPPERCDPDEENCQTPPERCNPERENCQEPSGGRNCVRVNRQCVPFDNITEDTELYVEQRPDGSLTGFDSFNGWRDHLQSAFGIRVENRNGHLHIPGVRWTEPGQRGTRRDMERPTSAQFADQAIFFARGGRRGFTFGLNKPDGIADLRDVRFPGGGTWNNRISRVSALGGPAGKPGVVLCAKRGCPIPGLKHIVFNDTNQEIIGTMNNAASAVQVFP